jgi:hypothetical protein
MMETDDERILYAVRNTVILRAPKQSLYTFGTTNIYYYLVTEPVYSELVNNVSETVVREGRVIAQKPRIVTPYYLSSLDGFSPEARRYFRKLVDTFGSDSRGLFYTYRNEPKELNIISENIQAVIEKLNSRIDEKGDPLSAIIKGQDNLWDVSLIKFIYEITRSSLHDNLHQLDSRGLLDVDSKGIPADARERIEELFRKTRRGEIALSEFKDEIDRWGLFDEYEDRFYEVARSRR